MKRILKPMAKHIQCVTMWRLCMLNMFFVCCVVNVSNVHRPFVNMFRVQKHVTHLKCNITPEKLRSQKESNLPTIIFSGANSLLNFGGQNLAARADPSTMDMYKILEGNTVTYQVVHDSSHQLLTCWMVGLFQPFFGGWESLWNTVDGSGIPRTSS